MKNDKKLEKTKEYILREEVELRELLKDLKELETLLSKSHIEDNHQILVQFYVVKLKKKDNIIQRIEKRIDLILEKFDNAFISEHDIHQTRSEQRIGPLIEQLKISKNNILKILGKGGELNEVLKKKSLDINIVKSKIFEALGSYNQPGLHSLLIIINKLLEWYELKKSPTNHHLEAHGFVLPPGYTILNLPLIEIHNLPQENVRWFDGKGKVTPIPFLFDKNNKDYDKLVKRFRKDTRTFSKYLQKAVDQADLPIWVKYSKVNAKHKNSLKINFLFAPLYFDSNETKNEDNRHQWSETIIEFMIHLDSTYKFQIGRFKEFRKKMEIIYTKHYLANKIDSISEGITKNYGHWAALAEIFIEPLKESFETYKWVIEKEKERISK